MTRDALRRGLGPYLLLLVLGAGWGLTQPLAKIAVSTGYRPLGLIFWQLVVSTLVLGALMALTGRALPRGRAAWGMCLVISLVGTVLPNSFSYLSISHLPSGVVSIVLSMVPMFAFPIALGFGNDRFSAARLAGLCLGLLGVALIALPQSSLPSVAAAVWLPVALIAPAFYALEGNVVARWGTGGLDPLQLLFGASAIGLVIALPAALISGQFIIPVPAPPEAALATSAAISSVVYAAYVWLIGRAGPVFAAQVSYLVTGCGVLWAMGILGERYSGWVWAAFAVMLAGLVLVRPRRGEDEPAIPAAPEAAATAAETEIETAAEAEADSPRAGMLGAAP